MTDVELTVYPDSCDAFGHLNQASVLTLFERARWDLIGRGPGTDLFRRHGVWPAVRRAELDYQSPAFPGDVLQFDVEVLHRGRTSFSMRQVARQKESKAIVADGTFTFVLIDATGKPVPIPEGVAQGFRQAGIILPAERITVNGVGLVVERWGSGTPVLFLHGFPLDRSLWRPLEDRLSALSGIAPDLRGFGDSDAPDVGYSMATYARDMIALLDTLKIESVVLCGLSMGGYIAFEMLRQARNRVQGLILISTQATPDDQASQSTRDRMATSIRERGVEVLSETMLPLLLGHLGNDQPGSLQPIVRDVIDRTPLAGALGALIALRDRPDSRPLLPTLEGLPTLVLGGALDRITPPPVIEGLASEIPGAEFEIMEGVGHLGPIEDPDQTAHLVGEFLGVRNETNNPI